VPQVVASSQDAKVELAYPNETGQSQTGKLGSEAIEYRKINGDNVYEGDILLTDAQVATGGPHTESAGRTSGKWPSAVVYYTIDPALPNQARVTDAIAQLAGQHGYPIRKAHDSGQLRDLPGRLGLLVEYRHDRRPPVHEPGLGLHHRQQHSRNRPCPAWAFSASKLATTATPT
jgi:hypothetical protein